MIAPQELNPEYPVKGIAAAVSIYGTLLDDVTAESAGAWMDVRPCSRFAVEVTGTGTDFSIQLYGSLAEAPPITTGGTPGSAVGSAITSLGITYVEMPLRFVRAALASIGCGNVTVNIQAVAP